MTKSSAVATTVLLLSSIFAGCATTKYQCPTPNGVACMSATEVYKLTNPPGKAGIDAATGAMITGHKTVHSQPPDRAGAEFAAQVGDRVVPLPKPGDVVPIREPSRVMRIWVGPWEDTNGNLVMATRIYTEIEAKRWSVGEPAARDSTITYPLQVDPVAPAASDTKSNVSPGASVVAPGTEARMPE